MLSGMTLLLDGRMAGGAVGHMMRGGMGGGFFLGGLFNLLWTVLIVLLVLWMVRNWSKITAWGRNTASSLRSSGAPTASVQNPLEVVQLRYAKGEISREEYLAMRRDLGGEEILVTAAPANS
jgi:putative membrane protein